MYPDDCLQSIIPDNWWIESDSNELSRGSLILAFVPHVDQIPYTIEPIGRAEPTQHNSALVKIAPLRISHSRRRPELPVAAMPLYDDEVWAAYRAKIRPCLVLGYQHPRVEKDVTRGMANRATAPTVIAAPYYGAKQQGKRGGHNEKFIERVRHCEYPQFVWYILPGDKGIESILRLDHLQPIGTHHNSFTLTGHILSDDAMEIMDELVHWLVYGGVTEDSLVALYRADIEETFGLS